jgi:S1-C subfamily serine protease
MGFHMEGTGRAMGLGSATPIDRRGYLLTAAHCVATGKPHVVLFRDGKLTAEPARVVWRGDRTKGEPDIAILFVARGLDQIYEWSTGFAVKDRIMSTGPSYERVGDFTITGVGGVIAQRWTERQGPVSCEFISHSAPIHRGDSGGPLLTERGQLIGINVAVTLPIYQPWRSASGKAVRPDLEWLSRILATDAEHQLAQ